MMVVVWATGWTIGVLGFDFQQRLGIFLFTIVPRPAFGAHPASYLMGTRGSFPDHSPPFSAEVKNTRSYTSTPAYAFMELCSIKKSKETVLLLYLVFQSYTYISSFWKCFFVTVSSKGRPIEVISVLYFIRNKDVFIILNWFNSVDTHIPAFLTIPSTFQYG